MIAALAAGCLLFAQVAVSAYACPGSPAMAAAAQTDSGVSPSGCEDLATRNLCAEHCAYGSSTVGSHSASPEAAQAFLPAWRAPRLAVAVKVPGPSASWWLTRAAFPPPPILFGVLRI